MASVLCLLAAQAEEGRPLIRVFPPRETGGVFYHWSGVQDEHGVLYFGSDVVLSYDGERWQHRALPGVREIRALALGSDGRLWIGGLNEIGWFDRGPTGELLTYHSLLSALPAGTPPLQHIWHVFPRGAGAVFVGNDLVVSWDGKKLQIYPLSGARRLPAMEVEGEIYVSHSKRGLWRVTPEGLRPFISYDELSYAEALNYSSVGWMEKTRDGWLLSTSNGLARFEHGRILPFAPEIAAFLRNNVVTSTCRLPDGRLCIGTVSGGVVVLDRAGNLLRKLTPADGLQSNTVLSLLATRDGALWVSSALGLVRVGLSDGVTLFDARRGLTNHPINRVTQAGSRLLAATHDGIAALDLTAGTDAQFAPLGEGNALGDGKNYAADVASDGDSIYIGSFKGAFRWQAGRLETIYPSESDIVRLQRSAVQPGRLYLVSTFDLVQLDPAPNRSFAATTLGRFSESPTPVAEEPDGTLWIGSRDHGVQVLRRRPGAQPQPYQPPGTTAQGRAVVGSLGSAIVIALPGYLEVKPRAPSPALIIAESPASTPLVCADGHTENATWLAFENSFADGPRPPIIGRLAATPDEQARWTAFEVPGLDEIGELTGAHVDDRGIVWFAGQDGVLRLDPAQLRPVLPPRAPLIHASVPPRGALPFDASTATFEYSALEYGHRESLRFQTRLTEVHATWSTPSNNNRLVLAGLREGDYTLAVRVINATGQISAESTWPFTVLPPWYRSRLAYTGWTVLALAGVLGFVQWRSAYLRRRALQLELLVQKKTRELEQANAAKSEFIANMSHEIRNPISGIVGLSLALEETPLNARQKSLADSVRSCASLLATLVDDVLDFAKIEAGRIDLRAEPFDLRARLVQCGDMVRESLRAAGATLDFEIAADLPPSVIGDGDRVQQILLNYLTNAVKFGGAHPVTLGATTMGGDRVRLFVRDRGPGLTAAEASTLFTKFTRLTRANAEPIRGTGLGLALCRLLVTKMGGRVGVQSEPGAGATFWVELPLPAAPSTPTTAAAAPATTPALHALIVEDLAYNATAMEAVLRKIGISSEVATDGPSALTRLQAGTYDVVFMDWNLPGLSGTEVVKLYRAVEPPGHRTIIIATTAYSAQSDRDTCLDAGMDAFMAKPFTPEKIRHTLQNLGSPLQSSAPVAMHDARELPPMPEVANEPSFPAVDIEILRLLAEDTPGGLPEQIALFMADLTKYRRNLGEALDLAKVKAIADAAHKLRSQASLVHFQPLITAAADMEAHAASDDRQRQRQILAELDAALTQLNVLLSERPPTTASS